MPSNYVLSTITLLSLALKLWLAADHPYLHDWDERYHALVAKNMVETGLWWKPMLYAEPVMPYRIEHWGHNHVWLHKQPLTLWLIALSLKVFGTSALAVRLPSVLLSTLCVPVVYALGRRYLARNLSLLAAGLFAFNGLSLRLAAGGVATDHVDLLFMVFVLLAAAVVLLRKRQNLLVDIAAGVLLGCAVLIKWLPALVILLVRAADGYWGRRETLAQTLRGTAIVLIAAVVVFLPWQWFAFHRFPVEYLTVQAHNTAHLFVPLDGIDNSYFYFFWKLPWLYGEVTILALAWAGYRTWRGERRWLPLLIWIGVPFLFFTGVRTRMQAYLHFVYPALCLLSAGVIGVGWRFFTGRFTQFAGWGPRKSELAGVLFVGLALLSPIVRTVESLGIGRLQEKVLPDAARLRAVNGAVVVNCEDPISLMFFSDCVAAYEQVDPVVVDSLRSQGRRVVKW